MIGKEYKRCKLIWGIIIWDDFGAKIWNFQVGLLDVDGTELDLANEICDEVSREICLSSICSIKAVYLRQLNTGNSLFVISSSIDLFLQVGDWNGISSF